MRKINCLFIEDSNVDVEILEWELRKKGILLDYIIAETVEDISKAILDANYQIIFSDHFIPRLDSITAHKLCQRLAPKVPFVLYGMYIPVDVLEYFSHCNDVIIITKSDTEKIFELLCSI